MFYVQWITESEPIEPERNSGQYAKAGQTRSVFPKNTIRAKLRHGCRRSLQLRWTTSVKHGDAAFDASENSEHPLTAEWRKSV